GRPGPHGGHAAVRRRRFRHRAARRILRARRQVGGRKRRHAARHRRREHSEGSHRRPRPAAGGGGDRGAEAAQGAPGRSNDEGAAAADLGQAREAAWIVDAVTSDAEHNLGEAAGLPESHRGESARIEAFSDAIFGFAATLLVVSLEVPRDFAAMAASLRGFVAFGLSFATLAAIWTVHRGFFRRFPIGDGTTVVLNTVLMFLILFYVYPLKFLART